MIFNTRSLSVALAWIGGRFNDEKKTLHKGYKT